MSRTILDTIYKRDVSGNIRIWHAEVEGDRWRGVSGIKDGTMTESGWTTCEAKNIGRKNATTPEEQALAEAKAEYTKKLDRGFVRSIDDVDKTTLFKPMLATKWEDRKDKINVEGGVISQPKLDGMRCIARADGLWSRTGKPIVSSPHILEELRPVFEAHPDAVFDGEIYNHALSDEFEEIMSIARKTKPTKDDLIKARDHLQLHAYDMFSEMSFLDRLDLMLEMFEQHSVSDQVIPDVESLPVGNLDSLDRLYDRYRKEGYEGQIIRLPGPYQNKRSNFLIKRKEFIDAEFEILRIEEGNGNWAGYAKTVVCKMPDGAVFTGDPEFGAGLKGDQAYAKDILERADEFVGGEATVRFFSYTKYGKPRMGVAIALFEDGRDV